MSTAWLVIVVVGVASILFKAAGPVFLGGRPLPPRMVSVVSLIGPVMLTALVVTQTVGGDQEIVIDARLPGVAAAAVVVRLGAPVAVAMLVAAVVTGTIRFVT
jgi:branched-subunit amino acid transport protein